MLAIKKYSEQNIIRSPLHIDEKNYQIRFLLSLTPSESNLGSKAFAGKKILFLVSEDEIVKAILLDVGSSEKGCDLKVIERDAETHKIILEDQSGLIRMVMKADELLTHYTVSINHPLNLYRLDALTLHS